MVKPQFYAQSIPMNNSSLSDILRNATNLLHLDSSEGNPTSPPNLKALLDERLRTSKRQPERPESSTLASAQLATATEALTVVETVNAILLLEDTSAIPLLGIRDWRTIRTLISLVFKWGIEPLVLSFSELWATNPKAKTGQIVEVDSKNEEYRTVTDLTTRFMLLLFPQGVKGDLSPTSIATEVAGKYTADILRPAMVLGWLPKSLATQSLPVVDHLRPFAMRLLSILTPALVINALGTLLSDSSGLPPYARRTVTSFLGQQLLRPGGVLGLCESVLGKEEEMGEDVDPDKLEKVSRTLVTVPTKSDPKEYYFAIIPRIIQLLSDNLPGSYRKFGAFTLSQMLRTDKNLENQTNAVPVVCDTLHAPLLPGHYKRLSATYEPLTAQTALSRLIVLIANCDPSPEVISKLLSPIIPSLYSLLFHLASQKASDPQLKERIQGLLSTWGKIVDTPQAIHVLWLMIIEGAPPTNWTSDAEGKFSPCERTDETDPLSLLLPGDKRRIEEDSDVNTNLFDLYPDPAHFVAFLKSLDRGDIASELFIKLLEAYRNERAQGEAQNPMKSLHYLQIFMQMQVQLLGDTSSSILKKPDQLLSFIKQVLETTPRTDELTKPATLNQPHQSPTHDEVDEVDSDDDDPDSEVIRPDDEMLETTLNLLLAVLESHEDISVRSHLVLNDIFTLMEPLSFSSSSQIGPLAREGRMVITARSASYAKGQKASRGGGEGSQEKYQKALKLLQDPILPVRAHGLLLLRELVSARATGGQESEKIEPALAPAVLSIFLQSIQDEDSYIFLNGVQGLAAMVDGFGHQVLASLVREYRDGLEANGTFMSQQDLDVRLRVGEALAIVIRRCGTSLGKHRDLLMPALIRVFQLRTIPVTLRTSSLSLLADAIDTYPLVMAPYIEDLAQGMIDMLQVESRSAPDVTPTREQQKDGEEAAPVKLLGDNDHLSADSKYPPLRRAGLHLLGLLVRSTIRGFEEDEHSVIPFSGNFVQRARITLGYVASTDNDTVVRVMAREIREELLALESSVLGYT
ncbi:hypothetical protein FA15DRAFT_633184 [Coprinopsis marcescibilis]|uniref:Uncharacterized protein n=1 Tax=Coprinopsis marcescibilis TaxID=230819 RepID=A0A5C3L7P3_COPMA|nr:hypothetical protein FA15DRAFT_633184 [Coprinopsis marcescibilis]